MLVLVVGAVLSIFRIHHWRNLFRVKPFSKSEVSSYMIPDEKAKAAGKSFVWLKEYPVQ